MTCHFSLGKGCEGQIRFDETRSRLEWDEPTCEGWRQDVLSHYTATIEYTTGISKTYTDMKETFIVIAEPFVQVSVTMTNTCGEKSTLATLNYGKTIPLFIISGSCYYCSVVYRVYKWQCSEEQYDVGRRQW